MKTLILIPVISIILFFSSTVKAEVTEDNFQHDVYIMMKLLNHALCHALEGTNLQMIGQRNMSSQFDTNTISHGTKMVRDGKFGVMDVLNDKAMILYSKRGTEYKRVMDSLYKLGEDMMTLIEEVEKLHKSVKK